MLTQYCCDLNQRQNRKRALWLLVNERAAQRRGRAAMRARRHAAASSAAFRTSGVAEPIEFLLSATLSERIDLYLDKFRNRIPGATRLKGSARPQLLRYD
jgi:hypothetical protein